MAKARKTPKTERQREAESGLTSFQVRVPTEVHEKLKSAAKDAQLSLNQLMAGICQFAADNIRPGRPIHTAEGLVEMRALQCVWFGYPSESEIEEIDERKETYFKFLLDFSGRNAVGLHQPSRRDNEGELM